MEKTKREDIMKTEVKITDYYSECISDSFFCNYSDNRKKSLPRGYVEVYDILKDGTKKLIEKNNLILYQGREWIATRIFYKDNANISTDKDDFICWFGCGTGGVSIIDPFDPISPTNEDTELNNICMINASDANCADYRLSPVAGFYKHPFDSITFEQDTVNDDKYLIVKINTTLGADDANGERISEVGLYISDSDAPSHPGPFYLYARATFPTILKDISRSLLFVWYVFV